MIEKNLVISVFVFVSITFCEKCLSQTSIRVKKNEISTSLTYKLLENKNVLNLGIHYQRAFAIKAKGYFSYKLLASAPVDGSSVDYIFSSLVGYNRYLYGIRSYANLGVASSIYGIYNKFFGLMEIGALREQRRINIGLNSQLFLHPKEYVFIQARAIAPYSGPIDLKRRAYIGLGAFLSYKF